MRSKMELTGDMVRDMLEEGAANLDAAAEDAVKAAGGTPQIPAEGFEVTSVVVEPPISEAQREALRSPVRHSVGLYQNLQPGPTGRDMITGSRH